MAYQLFSYKKTVTPWYYPGKIRRRVLIFFGICLILSPILYFTAGFLNGLWYQSNLNSDKFTVGEIVLPENQEYQELLILPAQNIDLSNGDKLLYTSISNKANKHVGFNPLFLKVDTLNETGTIIDTEIQKTYISPDEIIYVSTLSQFAQASNLNISVMPESKIRYINYNNPKNKPEPELEIYKNEIIEFQEFNRVDLQIGIYNPEAYEVKDIELTYFLRIPATQTSEEKIVGVSKYYISGIKARSTEDVRIQYPLNSALDDPKFLDVRWRVNLFE